MITRPDPFCTEERPVTQQTCYNAPCPTQASLHSLRIEIDPSMYVQMRKRKNIVLNVGGKATLIAKTSVSIRCSVKHFDRQLIKWRKEGQNDTFIPLKGRVRVTTKGVLRLRKTKISDKGKYTCIAGSHSSSVELSFHSAHDGDNLYKERMEYIGEHFGFIMTLRRLQEDTGKEEMTLPYLLGSLDLSDIPLHFMEGEWGVCSKSCGGGAGLQQRDITCEVVMENYYLVVDDKYCLRDDTVMKPLETRDCGFHKCPTWEVGEWSQVRMMHRG